MCVCVVSLLVCRSACVSVECEKVCACMCVCERGSNCVCTHVCVTLFQRASHMWAERRKAPCSTRGPRITTTLILLGPLCHHTALILQTTQESTAHPYTVKVNTHRLVGNMLWIRGNVCLGLSVGWGGTGGQDGWGLLSAWRFEELPNNGM